jgi:WD40 repeat protein
LLPRGDGIAAAFSPDGTKVAIATDQKEILTVDSRSAGILRSFPVEETIHSVCFTPCGSRLVAPVSRAEIGVWDVESGRAIARLPIPGGAAKSLALHPSGDSIAVATYNGTTLLMSLADGQVTREWSVTYLPVLSVTFRPDGQEIFAARCDGRVSVFSPDHDAPLRHFIAHQDVVRTMAFSGDRLMTGSFDGVVRAWNLSTTREIPLEL